MIQKRIHQFGYIDLVVQDFRETKMVKRSNPS